MLMIAAVTGTPARAAEAPHCAEEPGLPGLLAATLDEIDYGLLLVDRRQHVVHANHAARSELDAAHPLQLQQACLLAPHAHDAALLRDALADVFQRGHRKLITLGQPERRVSVSLVPLAPGCATTPAWALVLIGKPQVCQDLSVEAFARSHKLTPVETVVLKGLCRGAHAQRGAVDRAHARGQHPLQDQRTVDRRAGAHGVDAAAARQRAAPHTPLSLAMTSSHRPLGPLLTVVLSAVGTLAMLALGLLLLMP
jgi:hypothetical protein